MTADELAGLARSALAAHLGSRAFTLPVETRRAGVFVTLRGPDGQRGSVGSTVPDQPLPEMVARLAVLAATGDPRHLPVDAAELGAITIEVTVLDEPRRVRRPDDVDPRADALSVRRGLHSAVLLPDPGRGWNAETLLSALLHKAGLPPSSWKDGDAEVEARRAETGRSSGS